MSAARAAARNKPVLVIKAGRSVQGQAAAASHTGALASSDLVYDAAIRRAGMLRVDTLDDLFLAAEMLSHYRGSQRDGASRSHGLTIVTNGGGAGVMAAAAAALAGVRLAPLSPGTTSALDACLPPTWSHGNPVDIIGDAPVERYEQTLRTLLADQTTGSLLFMHAPTAIVASAEIARALLPVVQSTPGRVFSSWLGGRGVEEARGLFHDAGIPTYDTPEDAVRAFSLLMIYRQNQNQLIEAPPAHAASAPANPCEVRKIIDRVLAQGRELLMEPEAKALLAACGIPVVATRVVAPTPEAAVAASEAIGYPVAVKILSPQITHKSDVGGVVLGLQDGSAVGDATATMLARVAKTCPDATIEGLTVQAMVRRPQSLELIVGASVDPVFGPVLMFGAGGTSVEVVADRAIGLPPLNAPLARALIQRTRVAGLLAGWRDVPPADIDAIVAVLTAISQLLADEPRIAEIDINPLLADAQGVIALDARVRISAGNPAGSAHFAILPYPAGLSESIQWHGRSITLRPIRPEDEAQHLAFLERLEPIDIRMRVFHSRRIIERTELARLTQIDYAREMAFIATAMDVAGSEETIGVVRAICDPDNQDAEFGILVRSDLKGAGLGELLMRKLIAYLCDQGTQCLVATVLRENHRMIELARSFGFAINAHPSEPDCWAISLPLV